MPAVRRTPSMERFWRVHECRCCSSACGRKSGVARDVLLNCMQDGERFVVFASHAGEDRDPPWWLDLRDAGEAEVMLAGERFRVRAREAEGAERERLWSEVTPLDDTYAEYAKPTARPIAVVVLDPV